MSVEPLAAHREVQVAYVPVDRLLFHPRNIRKDLGDLRELADSIATQGVLQPVRAEKRGDTLRLLAGHRRVAAARLAGLRKVPCVIVGEHDDDEAIMVMLSENLNRCGISKEDRAEAIRSLRTEFGMTAKGIAERLGVSTQTVGNWQIAAFDPQPKPSRHWNEAAKQRQQARPAAGTVYALMERWRGRAPDELLAELDELIGGWRPAS